MTKKLSILLLQLAVSTFLLSQEETEDFKPSFSFGVNIGAHFANNNTAILYSGASSQTQFGILRTMQIQQNRQRIDNYFQQNPYQVVELPLESRYQSTVEIGIHINYQLSNTLAIFADLNSVQLDYEQFMTIEVSNPNNNSPQDDLERFPVIGEENRFFLNLGVQYNYYYEEGLATYISLLGNINDIELRRNYFIIDNFQYEIQHPVNGDFLQRPGGIGYGGGIGTGVKFRLGAKLYADLYYTLLYTKTYMNDNLEPYGTQHSAGIRFLWKTKDKKLEEEY